MSDDAPAENPHSRCDYVCLAAQTERAAVAAITRQRDQLAADLSAVLALLNDEKLKTMEFRESLIGMNLRAAS